MIVNYRELLDQIDAEPMTFVEFTESISAVPADLCGYECEEESCPEYCPGGMEKNKIMLLRHDIDGQIDKAVKMAKWEAERDIRATYFILSFGDYFKKSSKFIDQCKTIQGLGHEIGLHNNSLRLYLENGLTYGQTLSDPLHFLRVNGIDICGTSAHFFDNCQMWNEFDPTKYQVNYLNENFPKMDLADYGFDYEAYFTDFDVYLTDSGRHISSMVVADFDPFPSEHELRYSELNRGLAVIDEFNKMDQGTIQVLIHPQSWRFKDGDWTFKEKKLKPYISDFPRLL